MTQFIHSDAFSELPCLDVDSARKKVIGGCFHSSACENWTEEYDITGFDTLSKTLQFGTMC